MTIRSLTTNCLDGLPFGATGAIVVRSTTGTAPLTFTTGRPGQVVISLDDGSAQVYELADLRAALASLA
jgi:hypothetical protein